MKIFCIGSNLESKVALEHFIKHDVQIDTLLTLPSGEYKGISDYVDLHDFSHDHGIQTIDTIQINSDETVALIKEKNPDYLFTLGWSQIYREPFLKCFNKLVVGSHPSALPYGRGRAPIPWTILEDLEESAASLFKIDLGVDTGLLIGQKYFSIPPRSYALDVYRLAAEAMSRLYVDLYTKIKAGDTIICHGQSGNNVSHRAKRIPEDGWIDFKQSAEDVDRLIRAVSYPYPGAYAYYRNDRISIWKSEPCRNTTYEGVSGQILKKDGGRLMVKTRSGNIWLSEFSDVDGNEMTMDTFKLEDRFGYNMEDAIYRLTRLVQK